MSNAGHGMAGEGRPRSDEKRIEGKRNPTPSPHPHAPAAGAHAADHLVNEDATPGSGALPSGAHSSDKDVDGGAG